MNKKKLSALLLAGTLTAGVVGGTFAWFTSKDTVTNPFTTTGKTDPNNPDSGIEIVEEFTKPDKVLPGDETNKDVQVKNTANYDQFIRVKFEKKFVKVDENENRTEIETNSTGATLDTSLIKLNFTNHVKTKEDIKGTDGNVDFSNLEAGDWFEGDDGYYYYIGKVAEDSHTNTLLDSVTLSGDAGNEYRNLDFDVTVVAESIQASNNAYTEWKREKTDTLYSKDLNDILDNKYPSLQAGNATDPVDALEPDNVVNNNHVHGNNDSNNE